MAQPVRKAVILAGGYGTRLAEETVIRPKPLVEIGGKPILWHIMKLYSHHGVNEFIICVGYKGYMVKEYFVNYYLHTSDITLDFRDNTTSLHNKRSEDWRVTLIDTGTDVLTGGRLKRVREWVGDEPFCMTYGDGVSDVDVTATIDWHLKSGCHATVTVVSPPSRYGAVELSGGDIVERFREKPVSDDGWISGGFFVLSPAVFDYIDGDATAFEAAPLEALAAERQITAFRHHGFWQAMDTLRDKTQLEALWATGDAPWRVWRSEGAP